MSRIGVLAGPLAGIAYETPSFAGTTNAQGEFQYHDGEHVDFLLGEIVIGTGTAAPRMDLSQIMGRAGSGHFGLVRFPLVPARFDR